MFCLTAGAKKLQSVQCLSLGGVWGEPSPSPMAWHGRRMGPALGTGAQGEWSAGCPELSFFFILKAQTTFRCLPAFGDDQTWVSFLNLRLQTSHLASEASPALSRVKWATYSNCVAGLNKSGCRARAQGQGNARPAGAGAPSARALVLSVRPEFGPVWGSREAQDWLGGWHQPWVWGGILQTPREWQVAPSVLAPITVC